MNWFKSNPYGNNPSWRQSINWGMHKAVRQGFISNFSRNGMSAMLFSPTPGSTFKAAIGKTHEAGSPQQIRNLQSILARDPSNKGAAKALTKARKIASSPSGSILQRMNKKVGGLTTNALLSGGFYGYTFATTPGSLKEKSQATISEMVGMQAFKPGMALGAAIGSSIMPVIGTGIGAIVGGIGAQIGVSNATDFMFKTTDRMVQRERDRRNLNWVGDTTAFNTQGAYTMRQQSLSAMNRGMTTARSALGREAIMVHQ